MQYALYLPQLRMSFGAIEERATAAEALGFRSVWLMDHLAAPAMPEADTLEAWTVASVLAARTSRIRIGHLVLCDAFRHPALLAKMAATLDVLSDGRLELGIGWGSVEQELRAYGVTNDGPAVRAGRLSETLDILRLMFSGRRFDYEGQYYRLADAIGRPVPAQGQVPLHVGGAGPRLTLPLVARHADWWNCPSYAVDRLDDLRHQIGRARVSTQHPVALAPSRQARDEVVATARRRFGSWGGLLAGTAEEVATALAAEAAAGVELCILQFSDFGAPETLARFASDVAPAIRDAPSPARR
ncbi:MAG TPA: LLM class flavin-dependent oxidoreductase [Acidimicrobiales bacterium]|nr:LLM class flavin-dependent oxidoreductase [Acidimicrobiales bacterium]